MSQEVSKLHKRRLELLKKRDELNRELAVIDSIILDMRQQNYDKSPEKFTKKRSDSIYYMKKVIDTLKLHDVGLTTRKLYDQICISLDNDELNYSTFRSYLNRMREKGDIHQSSQGLWQLKN